MKNENEVGKLEGGNTNDRVRARDYSTTKFILKNTSIKSIGGMRKQQIMTLLVRTAGLLAGEGRSLSPSVVLHAS